MAGILKGYDVEVITVGSVKGAIDALQPATQCAFSHVILDLMLPDGDGAAVMRYLRDHELEPVVCVVTAANDRGLLEQVRAMNPRCVLRKPIDVGELLGKLDLVQ